MRDGQRLTGSSHPGCRRRQRAGRAWHEADQSFRRRPCQTENGDRRRAEAATTAQAQANDSDHANYAQAPATASQADRRTQGMMMNRTASSTDPVQRAVHAAEGWLALGAAQAAREELATLEPTSQTNPAVLHQQARILVALGRVKEAKETVRRLARLAPGWRLALLDDPALDPIWT